mgnify:CR=1 FL=1
MKEIRTFYNEKREKNEQKSQENPVTCNIINLHLEKPSSIVNRNESAKNFNYSKEFNQKNYINEIGMKVNPAFGRTTYSFYNKSGLNASEYNKEKLKKFYEKLNPQPENEEQNKENQEEIKDDKKNNKKENKQTKEKSVLFG